MQSVTVTYREGFLYHAPKTCAWCGATGLVEKDRCPACDGKGYVLTVRPETRCPCCIGSGRSPGLSPIHPRCAVCGGSGWLTRKKQNSGPLVR